MKQVGIRVRPVIRHVVTKWESDPERGAGGSSPMGEFAHESYADEVAQALREKYSPRCFAIVEVTLGSEDARVTYAYSEEEAASRKTDIEQRTGKTFEVYSRIRQVLPD